MKRFGDVVVVDAVSLDIFPRELFCLLGPSGCGKTTLMRMVAGFERPDAGRILLDGEDIAGVPPWRRPVNMMFQSYALFPHMSVAANVAYGLKQEGLPRATVAARVEEMLSLVQLGALKDRRPHQLSGGQKQRVALARALARRPKVLLLDEPLAALDRKLREETQFELMEWQAELGTVFILVTHDQDEAMTMADRIAVMERGRLAQVGTPEEVYENPATRSVAAFIGDATMFEGKVTARAGGRLRIACAAAGGEIEAADASFDIGAPVVVAVRPEKVLLHRGPAPAAPNLLPGVIWDIAYIGDLTFHHVKLDSGPVVKTARANTAREAAGATDWDERVHVSFPPEAAIVVAA